MRQGWNPSRSLRWHDPDQVSGVFLSPLWAAGTPGERLIVGWCARWSATGLANRIDGGHGGLHPRLTPALNQHHARQVGQRLL